MVPYKQGIPRDQLYLIKTCIDDIISNSNPVRVIDAYVEKLELLELGFTIPELRTGTPPYRPQLLLKIYIYGYLEKLRSSRKLEKGCNRNQEMIWLTEGLAPDFKTIADFRKDNREGIKNIFKEFLYLCHTLGLLSLEKIAIDGSKLRAQNSIKNIYKRNEMDKIQERIKNKIDEYLAILDAQDKKEQDDLKLREKGVEEIVNKLKKLKKYHNKVEEIKNIFKKDKELETYFATDNTSRFQSDNGKVKAGYNVQVAGDDKNKLLIVNDVTNQSNDYKQMTPMVGQVKDLKEELGIKTKTDAIMDCGYFNEKEVIKNNQDETIDIIVPDKKESSKIKNSNKKQDKVPAEGFEIDNFTYNEDKDVYTCPEGQQLHRTHNNPGTEKSGRKVFEFQCYNCENCKSLGMCTKNKKGRSIKVSVNKEYMDSFKKEMKTDENKKLIQKRKEIIEHPFGTIKRNWGYTYFMQRGIKKVKAEFSFICFIYNFKRVLNIISVKKLIEVLS